MNPDGTPGETWNPIIGCSHCSPGCLNCYAERMARRLKGMGVRGYADVVDAGGWTGTTVLQSPVRDHFEKLPKKPLCVFVGSMCDLFHESVPVGWTTHIFDAIQKYKQHTFMFLTKRPGNMKKHLYGVWGKGWRYMGENGLIPNLWLGVTVCNQAEADAKIPVLVGIPAAKRFVSIEPCLSGVELGCDGPELGWVNYLRPPRLNGVQMPGIDWVICGSETGPGKRPMELDWARNLRDQCVAANVPFFFKKDSAGSRLLDGQEWSERP